MKKAQKILTVFGDLSLNHGAIVYIYDNERHVIMYNYPPHTPIYAKAHQIVETMTLHLEGQTFDRVHMFYEATVFGCVGPGFSQYNMLLGQLLSLMAITLLADVTSELLTFSILPTKLKKHTTGNGRATKDEMLDKMYQHIPTELEIAHLGQEPKVKSYTYETYKKFDKECDLIDTYAIMKALGEDANLFTYDPLTSVLSPAGR